MADFVYPTSAELQEIAQALLPRLEADRPVFKFFPIVDVDEYLLMWEQRDRYTGLQQVRGLNGEFPKVKQTGLRRYQMEPGVYGEHEPIDEAQLTMRRKPGTFGSPADISDLVVPVQEKMLVRRLDRQEWMVWTMLATGSISVPGPTGAILHQDSYTLQTFTPTVAWSSTSTATPFANFRAVQILARGYSVDFGGKAMAFMNQSTFNYLALNTNAADIYGRRVAGLATANNLRDINSLLQGDNLPEIVIYDRGYLDEDENFHLFIPTGTVIVIGQRPGGQPIGDYAMTRNANNPGMAPGAFMAVQDTGEYNAQYPRQLRVYDGHSGGVRVYYPSAIAVMNVG